MFKKLFLLLSIFFIFSYADNVCSIVGKIVSKKIIDIDGDNCRDIFIVHLGLEKHTQFYVTLFIYKDNKYTESVSFPINKISIFDVDDINGDGIKDFVYMYKKSVYVKYIRRNKKTSVLTISKPFRILYTDCLYSYPIIKNIVEIDFARDINNDGIVDFLLPVSSGYKYFQGTNRTYSKAKMLKTDMGAVFPAYQLDTDMLQNDNMFFNISLPEISFLDYDSDGEKDIIFVCDASIYIYRIKNKKLIRTPIILRLNFEPYLTQQGNMPTLKSLIKFDDDPYLDVIVQKSHFNRKNMDIKSKILIFKGIDIVKQKKYKKTQFKLEPYINFTDKGMYAFFPPIFKDYNNDQKLDFLILKVDFTIAKALSTLISKSTSGYITLFNQNDQNTFVKTDYKRRVKVHITFEKPFLLSIMNLRGDFNGDGILDLLLGSIKDNELTIFYGSANGTYALKPNKIIKSTLFLNNHVLRIDDNINDDIIMFNPTEGKFNYYIF